MSLPNVNLFNENIPTTATLHSFTKYNGIPVNTKPRIAQIRNATMQSNEIATERDLLIASSNSSLTMHQLQNGTETRTLYTLETNKYDENILYPIESRQNTASSCWISGVPAEYSLF